MCPQVAFDVAGSDLIRLLTQASSHPDVAGKPFFPLRLLMKHGTGRMFMVVPSTETLGRGLERGR